VCGKLAGSEEWGYHGWTCLQRCRCARAATADQPPWPLPGSGGVIIIIIIIIIIIVVGRRLAHAIERRHDGPVHLPP
jgi:purine-cytosine permease-like protein